MRARPAASASLASSARSSASGRPPGARTSRGAPVASAGRAARVAASQSTAWAGSRIAEGAPRLTPRPSPGRRGGPPGCGPTSRPWVPPPARGPGRSRPAAPRGRRPAPRGRPPARRRAARPSRPRPRGRGGGTARSRRAARRRPGARRRPAGRPPWRRGRRRAGCASWIGSWHGARAGGPDPSPPGSARVAPPGCPGGGRTEAWLSGRGPRPGARAGRAGSRPRTRGWRFSQAVLRQDGCGIGQVAGAWSRQPATVAVTPPFAAAPRCQACAWPPISSVTSTLGSLARTSARQVAAQTFGGGRSDPAAS